jgi:hypothetical protein
MQLSQPLKTIVRSFRPRSQRPARHQLQTAQHLLRQAGAVRQQEQGLEEVAVEEARSDFSYDLKGQKNA